MTWNSQQVSRICNVSLRQLQYWDERGIVPVYKDHNSDRAYTEESVRRVFFVSRLVRSGVQPSRIPRVSFDALNQQFIVLRKEGKTALLKYKGKSEIEALKMACVCRGPVYVVEMNIPW